MNSQTLPAFLCREKLVWRDDAAAVLVARRRRRETFQIKTQKPAMESNRVRVFTRMASVVSSARLLFWPALLLEGAQQDETEARVQLRSRHCLSSSGAESASLFLLDGMWLWAVGDGGRRSWAAPLAGTRQPLQAERPRRLRLSRKPLFSLILFPFILKLSLHPFT